MTKYTVTVRWGNEAKRVAFVTLAHYPNLSTRLFLWFHALFSIMHEIQLLVKHNYARIIFIRAS
jgi:hypothetical protein